MNEALTPKPTPGAKAPPASRPVGRRLVLGLVGLGAVGVAVGAPLSRGADRALSSVRGADPTGISDLIPGAGGWRYYSVTSQQPDVSAADYQLSVEGLVATPQTFSYADLAALPQTGLTRDFQCVTGWRVDEVPWSGVHLRDLLDAVTPTGAAAAVTFTSLDGAYTESLTMDQALSDEVLVATHMYGQPVTRNHGGPVRLYVAAMYGYKSLKWLGGITIVDTVQPGYWERRGYDIDAYVGASNGRSDEPI
ncbi:MAG TPA: molybdopterin-dependent oxidoreductase [Actinomycetes bacterium]|nr:molybdopterin-dependent oxidoreductase [Actinomycetes bacterium]